MSDCPTGPTNFNSTVLRVSEGHSISWVTMDLPQTEYYRMHI